MRDFDIEIEFTALLAASRAGGGDEKRGRALVQDPARLYSHRDGAQVGLHRCPILRPGSGILSPHRCH
jgi:hypothetical protein